MLLQHESIDVNKKNNIGWTILMFACINNTKGTDKILLETGIKLKIEELSYLEKNEILIYIQCLEEILEKNFEMKLKQQLNQQRIELTQQITEELLNPDNGKGFLKAKEKFETNYKN